MTEQTTTIPKGSWILITGVNGFVASHTAKQFLERGYRVRGTVRDVERTAWLTTEVLKSYADSGAFELVQITDFTAEHAFDEAIKGVSAVAHVASSTVFDADPNKVITPAVNGTRNLLQAASKEPSVKEFVYTSSLVAATFPVVGNDLHLERDTWNEVALQGAWAPPPYEPERAALVYAASKTAAEKAVWEFAEKEKPNFTVNAVLPPMILGEPLHKSHAEVFAAYIRLLVQGDTAFLSTMPGTITIDVKDLALLHVATILDPSVQNVRFHPWQKFCNYNDMLAIMRKVLPERKFIDDMPNLSKLSISTDLTQVIDLMKKWGGEEHRDGFVSLEQTVEENLLPVVAWGY